MTLDKKSQYVYRVGSENQYRIFWDGENWRYEFIAGGVLFDEQKAPTQEGIAEAISFHGMTLDQFEVDPDGLSSAFSEEVREKIKQAEAAGLDPCPKHGFQAKNPDNTCEACIHLEYPDDFKGSEGS